MRLTDLEPRLYGHGGEGVTRGGKPIPRREGVGMTFLCPCGCGIRAAVTFRNPIDGLGPFDAGGTPTWKREGDTFETMTLSPSILRTTGCKWHGWIRNGEIVEA